MTDIDPWPPYLHPAAAELPPLTDAEFAALTESLARDGYDAACPIVRAPDGRIIDGRHRIRAAMAAQPGGFDLTKFPHVTLDDKWRGREEEWVLTRQVARRNLTAAQRANCAARLRELAPGEGQRRGGPRGTADSDEPRLPRSDREAAEIANVSTATLRRVAEGRAELGGDTVDRMISDGTGSSAIHLATRLSKASKDPDLRVAACAAALLRRIHEDGLPLRDAIVELEVLRAEIGTAGIPAGDGEEPRGGEPPQAPAPDALAAAPDASADAPSAPVRAPGADDAPTAPLVPRGAPDAPTAARRRRWVAEWSEPDADTVTVAVSIDTRGTDPDRETRFRDALTDLLNAYFPAHRDATVDEEPF